MQKFSPRPFQKSETGGKTNAGDWWTVLGSLVSRNLCAKTVCKSFLLKTCYEKRLLRAGDWGTWRSMPGNPARDALPEFKIGEKQRWCVTVAHLIETLRLVGRNGSGDSFHLPPDLFVPFLKILKGGARKRPETGGRCAQMRDDRYIFCAASETARFDFPVPCVVCYRLSGSNTMPRTHVASRFSHLLELQQSVPRRVPRHRTPSAPNLLHPSIAFKSTACNRVLRGKLLQKFSPRPFQKS